MSDAIGNTVNGTPNVVQHGGLDISIQIGQTVTQVVGSNVGCVVAEYLLGHFKVDRGTETPSSSFANYAQDQTTLFFPVGGILRSAGLMFKRGKQLVSVVVFLHSCLLLLNTRCACWFIIKAGRDAFLPNHCLNSSETTATSAW